MGTELTYEVVDVFTERRFAGNPAAVVFGADGLPDEYLLAMAQEFNHTATAVVLPATTPEASIRLRWFTPSTEAQMCGHATLAAVHALLERGQFSQLLRDPDTTLSIETAAGALKVQIEPLSTPVGGRLFWLDLPQPHLSRRSVNVDTLTDLLGLDVNALDRALPVMETQDDDLLVFVDSFTALNEARPHFTALSAWCARHRLRAVCLATLQSLTPSVHVHSRFFAPASGVDEDPVTGSVHGPLAAYLVMHELVPHTRGVSAVTCVQAKAGGRAGLVRAMVQRHPGTGYAVKIAGECCTTMRGNLIL